MSQATRADGLQLLKSTRRLSYRVSEIDKHLKYRVEEGLVTAAGAGGSNILSVPAGRAIVNNVWFDVAATSLSLPSSAPSARRIDLVMLTPSAGLTVLVGSAAASPFCPEPSYGLGTLLCKIRKDLGGGSASGNVVIAGQIHNEARHRFLKILETTG